MCPLRHPNGGVSTGLEIPRWCMEEELRRVRRTVPPYLECWSHRSCSRRRRPLTRYRTGPLSQWAQSRPPIVRSDGLGGLAPRSASRSGMRSKPWNGGRRRQYGGKLAVVWWRAGELTRETIDRGRLECNLSVSGSKSWRWFKRATGRLEGALRWDSRPVLSYSAAVVDWSGMEWNAGWDAAGSVTLLSRTR